METSHDSGSAWESALQAWKGKGKGRRRPGGTASGTGPGMGKRRKSLVKLPIKSSDLREPEFASKACPAAPCSADMRRELTL